MDNQSQNELFLGGMKPFRYALIVFVALIPVAYAVALVAPGRKSFPFWGYVAVMHALLCAVVASLCKVAVSVAEAWMPRSRLNRYAGPLRNFIAALAVWPFLIAVIMVVLTIRK
jgi:hypothetical protein